MSHSHVLYHMVRADFLERVRRYSFLLTLGFAVYLGYAVYAGYIVVQLAEYRGIYNSAWLGCVMTLVTSAFLTLVGFYVVKNTIQRDRETRVGQILATTPMRKSFYTLAKTISNFALLAAMVMILALAALVMQVLQGEDRHIHIFQLVGPLLIFGLSALAVTAALAVLFETIPGLRGGQGNVIYFFVWTALLSLGAATVHKDPPPGNSLYFSDFSGVVSVLGQMQASLHQLDPQYAGQATLSAGGGGGPISKRFRWTGLHWNSAMLLSRVFWIALAAALSLLAAAFFDRFDPAREWRIGTGKPRTETPALAEEDIPSGSLLPPKQSAGLPRFAAAQTRARFFSSVAAELRLLLRGRSWWWSAVAAGLFIACLAAPLNAARGGVIIAAWVWPTLLWSQLGAREARHATQSLVFSCEHALQRQLPAAWTAGFLLALATGGGLGLRFLLSGNVEGLCAWMAGAVFIPSLALALGVWTESSKPFEALYTAWWYVGPANHFRGMDFMGTTPGSSTPAIYLIASAALLVAAYAGRRARMAYA